MAPGKHWGRGVRLALGATMCRKPGYCRSLPARAGHYRVRHRAELAGADAGQGERTSYTGDLGRLQTSVKGARVKLYSNGLTTTRITIRITSTNGTSLIMRQKRVGRVLASRAKRSTLPAKKPCRPLM